MVRGVGIGIGMGMGIGKRLGTGLGLSFFCDSCMTLAIGFSADNLTPNPDSNPALTL